MRIFIDFDDVIFNTKKFREDLTVIFALYGISEEEYYNSYFDPNDKRPVKSHDIEDQIERLKKIHSFDEKALRESVDNFMQDTSKYIFADVMIFADLHKNNRLSILSFGNKIFQEKKIRSSKIQKYIPNIIITDKTKSEALADVLKKQDILQKEKAFFLDDRVEQICDMKKKFPDLITILVKRPEGRYQEMQKCRGCDYETHNLQEAQKIIESIN